MKTNQFIWTDLSSYSPIESLNFYQKVFNWEIQNNAGYHIAFKNSEEIVGLYETPNFFKKIKMPHFWMNYIKVERLEPIVEKAADLGAIVEIKSVEFYDGKIALIRDPMGAGFTIYEGEKLNQSNSIFHGAVMERQLQVSNSEKVIPFYEQLFDWKISQSNQENHYDIFTADGQKISSILEIKNEVKGKYEYWVTTFGVENLEKTKQLILKNGGKETSNEGNRVLFTDNFREAFFYIEVIEVV